jgi:DNA-binding MarR family transcriptional regulator
MKLQDKGFVTIEDDAGDGRALRIRATEKCAQWGAENEGMAARFVDRMFTGLSGDEILSLSASLIKIFDNLGGFDGGKRDE